MSREVEIELKAKELVDKFKVFAYTNWHENKGYDEEMLIINTKNCAVIAVDEILKVVIDAWNKLGCGEIGLLEDYIPYIFWQKVKRKILTL